MIGSHNSQPVVQYNPSPNVQAKASALTGEVLESKQVQPQGGGIQPQGGGKSEEVREKDSLREAAVAVHYVLRPEKLDEGSKFLSNPDWPPLDALNGVASIFIDEFFLNGPSS